MGFSGRCLQANQLGIYVAGEGVPGGVKLLGHTKLDIALIGGQNHPPRGQPRVGVYRDPVTRNSVLVGKNPGQRRVHAINRFGPNVELEVSMPGSPLQRGFEQTGDNIGLGWSADDPRNCIRDGLGETWRKRVGHFLQTHLGRRQHPSAGHRRLGQTFEPPVRSSSLTDLSRFGSCACKFGFGGSTQRLGIDENRRCSALDDHAGPQVEGNSASCHDTPSVISVRTGSVDAGPSGSA